MLIGGGVALLLVIGLVLVFTLGGGSPKDATESDFCEAWHGNSEFDPDDSSDEQAEKLRDHGDELSDVGTPESISDEAREGFEIYVDALQDADADDIEEMESDEEFYDSDEQKKVEAFFEYAFETCAE